MKVRLVPLVALLVTVALLAACRPAADQVELLPLPSPTPVPTYPPIALPRDDSPHADLTEWWYYTGHLEAADGRRYGFEYVIFQTVRADYPVVYLGQLAVTDHARGTFQHTHRTSQGSQIGRQDGVDLTLDDWRMQMALGNSHLQASMDGYALKLETQARKPAALHDDDGLVSFDVAGVSYYYSYTRLAVSGTLVDHGEPVAVSGQAWFDHQWGNFLVMGGGWDWFSAQLDDGAELMLNHLRDDQDRVVGVWGTYVDPSGDFRPLGQSDFSIEPTGHWTSPHTGGVYPMGWHVTLREPRYDLRLTPVLEDQELPSGGLGPSYWEGENEIEGTRDGVPVRGQGYVELTGYVKR